MEFLLHLKEEPGCDYTIGCGETVTLIFCEDLPRAIEAAKQTIFEDGTEWVQLARLYTVSAVVDLPLKEWLQEEGLFERNLDAAEKVRAERAEYERLKQKFEGR